MKENCWTFMKCGREPGGANTKSFGVCPAALEVRLDQVHSGRNGGRACWVVAGTMCHGIVQGSFAAKFISCEKCEFFRAVREEEASNYQTPSVLLVKLRK